MFRILILQASHSLSDERTEYLVKDRLSFMRFLGLGPGSEGAGCELDLASGSFRGPTGATVPLRSARR